jgi:hypothetical protein
MSHARVKWLFVVVVAAVAAWSVGLPAQHGHCDRNGHRLDAHVVFPRKQQSIPPLNWVR